MMSVWHLCWIVPLAASFGAAVVAVVIGDGTGGENHDDFTVD